MTDDLHRPRAFNDQITPKDERFMVACWKGLAVRPAYRAYTNRRLFTDKRQQRW